MNTVSDWALVIAACVQAACAIVAASAAVLYTHYTKKLLDSHIEPSLVVELTGSIEHCTISIENDAGCELGEIATVITMGFVNQYGAHQVRSCLFSETWPKLVSGECVKKTVPLESAIGKAASESPQGYGANRDDISVEYSFVRLADRRRFSYAYHVSFLSQADGKRFVGRFQEPERIPSLKRHIVQAIKED